VFLDGTRLTASSRARTGSSGCTSGCAGPRRGRLRAHSRVPGLGMVRRGSGDRAVAGLPPVAGPGPARCGPSAAGRGASRGLDRGPDRGREAASGGSAHGGRHPWVGWPDGRSPFPGLRSFSTEQHRVFFGRSAEVTELTGLLRSPAERVEAAVLVVVGPSGCGKSSLARAGLLPAMAHEPGCARSRPSCWAPTRLPRWSASWAGPSRRLAWTGRWRKYLNGSAKMAWPGLLTNCSTPPLNSWRTPPAGR